MKSITAKIKEIVGKTVENNGYEFVDMNYGKKGSRWFLQVFADKNGGISIDDCSNLSKELGYELDRHPELFSHSYTLEVSSPGLERPLKGAEDFIRFKGHDMKIKLFSPLEKNRVWRGKIINYKDDKLFFKDQNGKDRIVEGSNIASANLEVNI